MRKNNYSMDGVTLRIDLDYCEGEPLGSAVDKVRAERRALLKVTQQKYEMQRLRKAEQKRGRVGKMKHLSCALLVIACILTSVMRWYISDQMANRQHPASNNVSVESDSIDSQQSQLAEVERRIHARFIAGNWRFKEAILADDGIRVYIQLPTALNVEHSYRADYIRQSLCPKADSDIWQFVAPERLSFYLYYYDQRYTTSAYCG